MAASRVPPPPPPPLRGPEVATERWFQLGSIAATVGKEQQIFNRAKRRRTRRNDAPRSDNDKKKEDEVEAKARWFQPGGAAAWTTAATGSTEADPATGADEVVEENDKQEAEENKAAVWMDLW